MKVRVGIAVTVLLLICVAVVYPISRASGDEAFLGDSLTERWFYPRANFGIHGNTTSQMLSRFPGVVSKRQYKRLILLGGTNDVLLRESPDVTIHNLEEIGDAALEHNTEPVLCEIPPIFHSYKLSDSGNYAPAVTELNRRIAELAASRHWKLIDYYTPLAGHPSVSADGVHLKRRGYIVMEYQLLKTVGLS